MIRRNWCSMLHGVCWLFIVNSSAIAESCPESVAGEKQLLWGDLHVHTAHSLDAWAFGAVATPKDAYAFAKGQPLMLANGETKTIDRPLDFAAVTDHPETWDQMYLCTDPVYADVPYCNEMRELRTNRHGRQLFNDYLLPVVGALLPKAPSLCESADYDCGRARISEWRRVQMTANEANEPCNFTALIGYEWTATPGGRHWHRNVIFASDVVPNQAFDYVRFPEVHTLWQNLSASCRIEDGCRVLTIPHNINWADGGSTFAVEDEDENDWAMRAKFERLAEIFQEKGASECLPERREDLDDDCSFELLPEIPSRDLLSGPSELSPAVAWKRTRSSYYRSLLGRGLAVYQSGRSRANPLMLGAIGSTDSHFGTPGRVAEEDYTRGISTLFATDEEQLADTHYNPGGLVAVWAIENTRSGVFDALYRREAYATSGPRIVLKFGVGTENYCASAESELSVKMGGTLTAVDGGKPWFVVQAGKDAAKLAAVQVIKGEYRGDRIRETVTELAAYPNGKDSLCVSWQDEYFDSATPAYWYARVLEVPTPRWSKLLCERAGSCDQFPEANTMSTERAWSSPVWWLP